MCVCVFVCLWFFPFKKSKNQEYFHLKICLHAEKIWNLEIILWKFYSFWDKETYTFYRIIAMPFFYQSKNNFATVQNKIE